MKTIIGILSLTTKHIDIVEGKRNNAIHTVVEVEEGRVQELLDDVEKMGGTWYVEYNSNGIISVYVEFKTSSDNFEYSKVARVINRHWFESKFKTDKEALMKYCEDILLTSK